METNLAELGTIRQGLNAELDSLKNDPDRAAREARSLGYLRKGRNGHRIGREGGNSSADRCRKGAAVRGPGRLGRRGAQGNFASESFSPCWLFSSLPDPRGRGPKAAKGTRFSGRSPLAVQPGPDSVPNVAVIHRDGAFFAHVDEYRFLEAVHAIAVSRQREYPSPGPCGGGHYSRGLEVQAGAIEVRRIRLTLQYKHRSALNRHFERHSGA